MAASMVAMHISHLVKMTVPVVEMQVTPFPLVFSSGFRFVSVFWLFVRFELMVMK
jgi:hypothetical protein